MKKFRLLAAMVITVAMLFTVALAADVAFDAIEYDGTADTVTVTVKTTKALDIDAYSTFAIDYNKDVYTFASATSCDAKAELKDYASAGRFDWGNPTADTAAAEGAELVTIVFNVKDKAAVVGTTFATNEVNTFVSAFNVGGDVLDMVISTTVTAAAQAQDPTYALDKAMVTLTGNSGEVYTNVWSGAYTVALNGNAATALKVVFDADHSYVVEDVIDGSGSVAFKIAVVGAPADAVGVPAIEVAGAWITANAQ